MALTFAVSPEAFIAFLVAHLIADWILQNEWMALNKTNIRHTALYVHGLIHFGVMAQMTGMMELSLIITLIHMAIDTRKPLQWWMRIYKQTTTGEYGTHVKIWLDQVLHIVTIYLVLALTT